MFFSTLFILFFRLRLAYIMLSAYSLSQSHFEFMCEVLMGKKNYCRKLIGISLVRKGKTSDQSHYMSHVLQNTDMPSASGASRVHAFAIRFVRQTPHAILNVQLNWKV